MCGRFALAVPRRQVAEAMGVPDMPDVPARPEIFPAQLIEAVFMARESGRRMAGLFRWGFVPVFLKDDPAARPMINARSETVLTLPSFRAAARYRRCLVPAQGYYEWRKDPGGHKTRFFLSLPGTPVLALAGIYERSVTSAGEVRDTVAILTRPAQGVAASVHPRMPLIIAAGSMAAWLDSRRTEREEIEPLLALAPPGGLRASADPGQPSLLVL
jgi:putative SOS response-associated peptidase YedK